MRWIVDPRWRMAPLARPSRGPLATLLALLALLPVSIAVAQGAQAIAALASAGKVDGQRAMQFARAVVGFGPRTSGSAELVALRKYLVAELQRARLTVEQQAFTARTPAGDIPMVNLIVRIPGNTGRRILITGHYDTKRMVGMRFVGANDAGSSTALLLELATVLARRQSGSAPRDEIQIVFFDGEEAFRDWTDTDSLYGSRHLAREMQRQGTIRSIRALINLDMVGDRNLNLALEYNSSEPLRDLALAVAAAQGHRTLFDRAPSAIEDDHIPFARLGVSVLNLIDFSYGPGHAYWHTDEDTIDKLAPSSFQTVGDLVLGILQRLER